MLPEHEHPPFEQSINLDVPPESEKIIVNYRGNYPYFMRNVKKYIAFINQIYANSPQVTTYLETIDTGLLCIYESLAVFQMLESPIPEFVKAISLQTLRKENNFLLEGIENGQDFPSKGYCIVLEAVSHPASVLFPNFKAFHCSMHPDIQVSLLDASHIQIDMPTFAAFKAYADLLFTCAKIQE